jgi:predicted alpha/beta-fold hydrolase
MHFRPAWWLPGPHTMTMWGKFVRKRELADVEYERIRTPDGDEITLALPASPSSGPILLLLHGLEGGVRSHYVAGIWEVARRKGWQPRVLLFRTCDGRMNSARRTYHSGETTDLDFVIRRLTGQDPGRLIVLAGVSLGGNVLLKWLGEQGESVPPQVRAAIAISTPYDLAQSSRAINTGFSRLYQWNFLRTLKRKAGEKLAQYPDVTSRERVESLETMWAFDEQFTAPLHGFRDAADYYERSSSIRFLTAIRTPTLLLSAFDDPFYTASVLRDVETLSASNPFLTLEFHARGGHAGFVGGAPWRPAYYVESRVGSFLENYLVAADSAD